LTIHRNSISVPEAVREILTRNYPVYQCLKMKLMNFHSLAEYIQPQVQQLSGKEASINTLVVAIKRFSDSLTSDKNPDASKVLKDARISLSSGIVDVTIRVPRNQFSAIVKQISNVAGELSEFPHIFPLSNSIKLILPAEDYALISGKLEHPREATTQANVSKLILNLSPHAEMTPGIASYITEMLFRNGVNILDAFLGYGDIIMVVDDKDGPLAYDVLQREIYESNQPSP
jgi:aspartokinase